MSEHTYIDSLETTARSAHSALLDRHNRSELQLVVIASKLDAIAAGTLQLMRSVETVAEYENSRLVKLLRWFRLL
jgi:hypothetical protein